MTLLGPTLGRYFAGRFVSALALVFLGCMALIAIVDFVEMLRRSGDTPKATAPLIALLTLSRAPALVEQMLPFAILFAGIGTFLNLSRRLELAVTRAAGVSAWQFLAPAAIVTALVGVAATTVYNPVAAALKDHANALEAEIFGARSLFFQGSNDGIWLRQSADNVQSVINAKAISDGGQRLSGVIVFTFDARGRLLERIEAQSARLVDRAWVLEGARVFNSGSPPRALDTTRVATTLTADQVRGALASADTVAFWDLPSAIRASQEAGLSPARYEVAYQGLLARPLMFVAMLMIAAAVSLRFFRIGGVAPLILGGVGAGFLLYVGTELAEDLASAGMISVVPAAWGPAAAGALLGFMVLLHQEDG